MRSPLDWVAGGFDEGVLDELIDLMLRIFESMVVDPPDPLVRGLSFGITFDAGLHLPSLQHHESEECTVCPEFS